MPMCFRSSRPDSVCVLSAFHCSSWSRTVRTSSVRRRKFLGLAASRRVDGAVLRGGLRARRVHRCRRVLQEDGDVASLGPVSAEVGVVRARRAEAVAEQDDRGGVCLLGG